MHNQGTLAGFIEDDLSSVNKFWEVLEGSKDKSMGVRNIKLSRFYSDKVSASEKATYQ